LIHFNLLRPEVLHADVAMVSVALGLPFRAFWVCTGAPVSADDEFWASFANEPNRSRWIIRYFSQPQLLIDYMAENCTVATLGGPDKPGLRAQQHFGYFMGAHFHLSLFMAPQASHIPCF
jgi:hypothetical protein